MYRMELILIFMRRKLAEENTEKTIEPFILSVGKDMGRDYKTLAEAVERVCRQGESCGFTKKFHQCKRYRQMWKLWAFVPF